MLGNVKKAVAYPMTMGWLPPVIGGLVNFGAWRCRRNG
jgi:hypothetical protein